MTSRGKNIYTRPANPYGLAVRCTNFFIEQTYGHTNVFLLYGLHSIVFPK